MEKSRNAMDDCSREAQDLGYEHGLNQRSTEKFKNYSNLQAAYSRGYEAGLREKLQKEKLQKENSELNENFE